MNYQFDCTENYGYLISTIFGKELVLYKDEEYNALKQCENIEEFSIKLMKNYKFITEDMEFTKNELRRRLNKTLIHEYNHFYTEKDKVLTILLDYYMENHMIHNFFLLLQSKETDPDLIKPIVEIGDFTALKTLKFCKDMHDVRMYCIENSFLKKYFYKVKWATEFKDNDFQMYQALFLKYLLEDTYKALEDTDIFMKEILKTEGDRYIIDLTINALGTSLDKKSLYPVVTNMDSKTVDFLSKVETLEEVHFDITSLLEKEINKYRESFRIYNDVTCVYSYLKLREQEIKNILWIIECVLQDRKGDLEKFSK